MLDEIGGVTTILGFVDENDEKIRAFNWVGEKDQDGLIRSQRMALACIDAMCCDKRLKKVIREYGIMEILSRVRDTYRQLPITQQLATFDLLQVRNQGDLLWARLVLAL